MPGSFKVFVSEGKSFEIPLGEQTAQEEWADFETGKGRWSKAWVEVQRDEPRATYVARDQIVRIEVDHSTPLSLEVSAQAERDHHVDEFRKSRPGHTEDVP